MYETQLDLNKRKCCTCSFKQNLYVFYCSSCMYDNNCFVYNIKDNKWSPIADSNDRRYDAACTVFEGKIVVSGGLGEKSVEAFDYYENKWTYLPDMIEKRNDYGAVSMDNKLFVIGGCSNSNCEIFDSFSRKFSCIKSMNLPTQYVSRYEAVCIGQTIIAFSM